MAISLTEQYSEVGEKPVFNDLKFHRWFLRNAAAVSSCLITCAFISTEWCRLMQLCPLRTAGRTHTLPQRWASEPRLSAIQKAGGEGVIWLAGLHLRKCHQRLGFSSYGRLQIVFSKCYFSCAGKRKFTWNNHNLDAISNILALWSVIFHFLLFTHLPWMFKVKSIRVNFKRLIWLAYVVMWFVSVNITSLRNAEYVIQSFFVFNWIFIFWRKLG